LALLRPPAWGHRSPPMVTVAGQQQVIRRRRDLDVLLHGHHVTACSPPVAGPSASETAVISPGAGVPRQNSLYSLKA